MTGAVSAGTARRFNLGASKSRSYRAVPTKRAAVPPQPARMSAIYGIKSPSGIRRWTRGILSPLLNFTLYGFGDRTPL